MIFKTTFDFSKFTRRRRRANKNIHYVSRSFSKISNERIITQTNSIITNPSNEITKEKVRATKRVLRKIGIRNEGAEAEVL